MQSVRSIVTTARVAITVFLVTSLSLPDVFATEDVSLRGFVLAQAGGFEKLPQSVAPTPYSPNAPSTSTPSTSPRFDPEPNSKPSSGERPDSTSDLWGSVAFTADGSYSSTWRMASQPEAEAKVLRQCARFGRGGCEVVSFSGQQCVSLATFAGPYRRRRWNLSFTAGGMTYPEAQSAAMDRCNADERTQGHCQPRTTACADGR
jgi:hypothetical protein